MTPQIAKDLLPIIQAYADGKTIQYRLNPSETFHDCSNLSFQEPAEHYRIKPEPREFWIGTNAKDGNGVFVGWAYDNQKDAADCSGRPIKVREVLE